VTRIALLAVLSLGLATPAFAQHTDHDKLQAPAAKQPTAPMPQQPAAPPVDAHEHGEEQPAAPISSAPITPWTEVSIRRRLATSRPMRRPILPPTPFPAR
jgi:hypothetical protein